VLSLSGSAPKQRARITWRAAGQGLSGAQDEVFGLGLLVLAFKDQADAVGMANHARYGLAGCIWSGQAPAAPIASRAIWQRAQS
jgi:acyl-CoA reductase-like NAD-dependent aldehyde dehydrogenase